MAQIQLHTFPISEKNKTQNPVPIISIKGLPDRAEEGFWHENGKKRHFFEKLRIQRLDGHYQQVRFFLKVKNF